MPSETDKEKKKRTRLFIAGVVLLFIIFFSIIFYVRASRPLRQARQEAVVIAEKTAKIKTVDDFYWFTRKGSYFTVSGKNDKNQQLLVVIPESGKNVRIYQQDDGITAKKAQQTIAHRYKNESFKKTSFGLFKKKPVWEVVTSDDKGNNYYLLQFKDGKIVKAIREL